MFCSPVIFQDPIQTEPRNFFGLALKKFSRFQQLDPCLRPLLFERMKCLFEEQVEEIRKLSSSQKPSSCFICFNTGEEDVKNWLDHALIPDLTRIGITTLCSRTHLIAGALLEDFMAKIVETDYAVVICTPEFNQKRLNQPESGVAVEIEHLAHRFKWKKGTTIPLYFKGKFEDYNPFENYSKTPFALHVPSDNYAGILELFTALRNLNRDVAHKGLETITARGKEFLDDLLVKQSAAVQRAFDECCASIKAVGMRFPSCTVVHDGQSSTDFWLKKHLSPDLQKAGIKAIEAARTNLSSNWSKTDVVLIVNAKTMKDQEEWIERLLVCPEKKTTSLFYLESDSDEEETYFCSALKTFAAIIDANFNILQFENRKAAHLSQIKDHLLPLKKELSDFERSFGILALSRAFSQTSKGEPGPTVFTVASLFEKRGKMALEKNEWENALSAFKSAHKYSVSSRGEHNPATLAILLQVALVNYRVGNLGEAKKTYEEILRFDEACFAAHHNLGRLCILNKEFQQAVEHFNIVRALNPSAGISFDYANLLYCQERYEEAIPVLLQVILQPVNEDQLTYAVHDCPALPRELHEEIIFWQHYTISTSHLSHFLLLQSYLCSGLFDEAQSLCNEFEKVVRQHPSTRSFSLLGIAYKILDRKTEALKAFQCAVELDLNNETAQANINQLSQ